MEVIAPTDDSTILELKIFLRDPETNSIDCSLLLLEELAALLKEKVSCLIFYRFVTVQ